MGSGFWQPYDITPRVVLNNRINSLYVPNEYSIKILSGNLPIPSPVIVMWCIYFVYLIIRLVDPSGCPVSTILWPSVGLMMAHRLQRCPNF